MKMNLQQRRDMVFLALTAIFVTNAILGEVMGGKLISFGPFAASIGVIPWPVVFITTDLINEYFGTDGVRKITLTTAGLISYAFIVLYLAMQIPAAGFSPVKDEMFNNVFGQSLWIIIASITAFLTSQMVDVWVFWFFRGKTNGKMLWLRATGSTAVSQLIDSVVIIGIAFLLPGKITFSEFIKVSLTSYTYKFAIAIVMTPVIYLGHNLIDKFLGAHESHKLIEEAYEKSHL